MIEEVIKLAPSWAVGFALVLIVIREIWVSIKTKDIAETALLKYQEIYNELETLEQKTGASRVGLLSGHNSGNPLDGLNKMYSSIVASTAKNAKWRKINAKWKGVEVDSDYIDTVRDIFTNKVIRIDTENLKEGSILRDLYESDGFKCSYIALVSIKLQSSLLKTFLRKPELLTFSYLSVNFENNVIDLATTREAVRETSNKIKAILNS